MPSIKNYFNYLLGLWYKSSGFVFSFVHFWTASLDSFRPYTISKLFRLLVSISAYKTPYCSQNHAA